MSNAPNIFQKIDQRQSQNLVMTPQLQQAIKLLQFNNVELAEFVEEELASNPLLEKDDSDPNGSRDEAVAGTEAKESATPREGPDEIQEGFDQSWTGNEADNGPGPDFDPGSAMSNIGAGGNRSFEPSDYQFEDHLTRPPTLREHLQNQLGLTFANSRDRMIGAGLIDLLDEGGYLRTGEEELAERLGTPIERVERLLTTMKQFDPPGIFARDLADCLALQLQDQGKLDEPMEKLLAHLDLLGEHDYKALAKKCGVNDTYLADMVEEIRALNPRPASAFEHEVVQTVVPDVLMKRLPKELGGGWRVELNNETLPRVLVNEEYYTEVAGQARQKKDLDYLNKQMQSASWLVKALDQRAKTILKVASEIIEQQNGFFLFGIEFLKPLTLKHIAEEIEMHESTVSRVTTNKYIGTPRGIFELKYFFSTALGEGDDAVSAESVKAKIRDLIDQEPAKKTLSDDKIAQILQEDGIDIARRTVAKYREAMHIPSSVQRRKIKKNLAAAD